MSTKISIDNVLGRITSDGQSISASSVEAVNVVASALTGTVNIDTSTKQIHYYSAAAAANWTPNIRSTSSASLNSAMSIGEAMTVSILATIGSSGYYSSAVQVDGNSIIPKWAGGVTPLAGNSNGIDIYSYTIVKTADATFTVLASVSQYA